MMWPSPAAENCSLVFVLMSAPAPLRQLASAQTEDRWLQLVARRRRLLWSWWAISWEQRCRQRRRGDCWHRSRMLCRCSSRLLRRGRHRHA